MDCRELLEKYNLLLKVVMMYTRRNGRIKRRQHRDIQSFPGFEMPYLAGKIVQVFPFYNTGPDLGHKTFIAIGKLPEKIVGNNGTQHRIAKVFKALVIIPLIGNAEIDVA